MLRRTQQPRNWLEAAFLLGIGGVFLTNAVVAVVQPADFTGLVRRSGLGRWVPPDLDGWLSPLIGLNDLLLGLALIALIWFPRSRAPVLAWAGLWLLAVSVIKLTALGPAETPAVASATDRPRAAAFERARTAPPSPRPQPPPPSPFPPPDSRPAHSRSTPNRT